MERKVLTIAGSDSSGGAGVQADLKTMEAHNAFGMSAITAITAQNTCQVSHVYPLPAYMVEEQINRVFEDIFPDSVKVGMVGNEEIIKAVLERLTYFKAANIVVDPVMVATSGSPLALGNIANAFKKYLFPIATVITPNKNEAEILAEMKIDCKEDMIKAARRLKDYCSGGILIKGGHMDGENKALDLLLYEGRKIWLEGSFIKNENTHGTGCTLSSAIASNLALGNSLEESVVKSKEYIEGCLRYGLDLGKGSGPLKHRIT